MLETEDSDVDVPSRLSQEDIANVAVESSTQGKGFFTRSKYRFVTISMECHPLPAVAMGGDPQGVRRLLPPDQSPGTARRPRGERGLTFCHRNRRAAGPP